LCSEEEEAGLRIGEGGKAARIEESVELARDNRTLNCRQVQVQTLEMRRNSLTLEIAGV
jgi:hypothetical protein